MNEGFLAKFYLIAKFWFSETVPESSAEPESDCVGKYNLQSFVCSSMDVFAFQFVACSVVCIM